MKLSRNDECSWSLASSNIKQKQSVDVTWYSSDAISNLTRLLGKYVLLTSPITRPRAKNHGDLRQCPINVPITPLKAFDSVKLLNINIILFCVASMPKYAWGSLRQRRQYSIYKAIKPAIKQAAPIDKYNTKALDKELLSHEGAEVSFNSYEVKIVLNWAKINTSVFSITSNSFFHLVLLVVHTLCNRYNKV